MKYRRDFVTNSSSSSFLVCYKNSTEMVNDIFQFVKNYEDDEWSHQYKDVIYDIFKNRISYEEAITEYVKYLEGKVYCILMTSPEYSDLVKKYNGYQNFAKSDEFKKIEKEIIEKEVESFKNSVSPEDYFALLEYSNSDGYYEVESDLQNMLKGLCIRMENH